MVQVDAAPAQMPTSIHTPVDIAANKVIATVRRYWWLIALAVLVGGVIGYMLSALSTVRYRATVTLVPSEVNAGSGGSFPSQLQGLAAIAGIALPSSANRAESLATLRSYDVALEFVRSQKLAVEICRQYCDHVLHEPVTSRTEHLAALALQDHVRVIDDDKVAGVIRISFIWPNRIQAAQLANSFVASVNGRLRERARQEAQRSLAFLRKEIDTTPQMEVRQLLFQMAEREASRVMLANVREDYAFRIVDAAVPPDVDRKYTPRRILWATTGALVGFFLLLFGSLLRGAFRRSIAI